MQDESAPPAEQSSGPTLVRDLGPAAAFDEPLTKIEAGYLSLAKLDSDRQFGAVLQTIIREHGHNPEDGRNYNFVNDDQGKLILRIAG